MNRAYSVITIKSVDEDQRVIEGTATTPATDREGDIIEPMGGVFSLPLPFKWQHGKDARVGMVAIGHVVAATPDPKGMAVRIKVERENEPGQLKDTLDFVWQAIKKGLVRGLSIGMLPLEQEPIKGSFGVRYKKWELIEISAVTIPANREASIAVIKSYDEGAPAAPGNSEPLSKPPGASGPVRVIPRPHSKQTYPRAR